MLDLNWFRGVIWPREKQAEGKTLYQYTIIGQLITDEPIIGFDGNQFLLDGNTYGLRESLRFLPKKEPAMVIGDANDVLLNLQYLVKDETNEA